ncbi:MAG TPA: AraC family transcriptional regulator [Pyrinomonadaceae bacterium]|jgi:AraC family transcriptional regulator
MKLDPGESRLINTRVLHDRRINEVFYPGGMRQDGHRHHFPALSFVLSGQYQECIGRQAHSRRMSTLIYHPADEKHAVAFESDVRILSVEFRTNSNASRTADSLDHGSSHRSELVTWLGFRLRCEMARSDSASALAVDGLISEMFAEGARGKVLSEEKGFAAWLVRATDYVHDNFRTTLSLEEIAKVAGVHSAHLSRVFRQKMGCTVGEYLRRLKFEFACQQILSTEIPLCEIALDAGFADQSHFNRIFRTKMGMPPYMYRKLHRKPPKNARFVQDFGSLS